MTYTREQLEKLSDRELDAVVVTAVMRWTVCDYPLPKDGYPVWNRAYLYRDRHDDGRRWTPSTSIADAWEVVTALCSRHFLWNIRNYSKAGDVPEFRVEIAYEIPAHLGGFDGAIHAESRGTPCRGICLAAILAAQETANA